MMRRRNYGEIAFLMSECKITSSLALGVDHTAMGQWQNSLKFHVPMQCIIPQNRDIKHLTARMGAYRCFHDQGVMEF